MAKKPESSTSDLSPAEVAMSNPDVSSREASSILGSATGKDIDAEARKPGRSPDSNVGHEGTGNPVPSGTAAEIAAANADLAAAAKATKRPTRTVEDLATSSPAPVAGAKKIQKPSLGRIVLARVPHPTRGIVEIPAVVTLASNSTSPDMINAMPLGDGSNSEGIATHLYSIRYSEKGDRKDSANGTWRYPPHVAEQIDIE